jgi:hypothetical protein
MKLTKKGKITHTVMLSGKDICELLAEQGTDYTPPPDGAKVEFLVPSGGDVSGEALGFYNEDLVRVSWVKEALDD